MIFFNYSKTCLYRPLSKRPKIGFQDRLSLNAGQMYCRILQESSLQYFRPSLSYHLSLRPLFCLFLSARLRQVLLYVFFRLWGAVNVVLFNLIVFLMTVAHLRAVLSDPGVVPLPKTSLDFSDIHSGNQSLVSRFLTIFSFFPNIALYCLLRPVVQNFGKKYTCVT